MILKDGLPNPESRPIRSAEFLLFFQLRTVPRRLIIVLFPPLSPLVQPFIPLSSLDTYSQLMKHLIVHGKMSSEAYCLKAQKQASDYCLDRCTRMAARCWALNVYTDDTDETDGAIILISSSSLNYLAKYLDVTHRCFLLFELKWFILIPTTERFVTATAHKSEIQHGAFNYHVRFDRRPTGRLEHCLTII